MTSGSRAPIRAAIYRRYARLRGRRADELLEDFKRSVRENGALATQRAALGEMLTAAKRVPHYQTHLASYIQREEPVACLQRLPLLTKEKYQYDFR